MGCVAPLRMMPAGCARRETGVFLQHRGAPRCLPGEARRIGLDEALPPMSAQAHSLHVEALLSHREFVRRLARSLVRDDATAEDVAQDVLVAAWRHPPRAPGALRTFLARATLRSSSNAARGAARRAEHEARAARSEAGPSEEQAQRDLELEQEVVGAVLALDEPYRSVVLLTYHEGLTAAAIAARRGIPAGTVRSQQTRALALLRERLDGR